MWVKLVFALLIAGACGDLFYPNVVDYVDLPGMPEHGLLTDEVFLYTLVNDQVFIIIIIII
jgi:hypothetical protein